MIPEVLTMTACNRCGECCIRGGECIYRQWDQNHLPPDQRRPWAFTGRCEMLEDVGDGSTSCRMLAGAQRDNPPEEFAKWVPGTCEFPDWRRELIQVGVR
jgi:hypothetical protein